MIKAGIDRGQSLIATFPAHSLQSWTNSRVFYEAKPVLSLIIRFPNSLIAALANDLAELCPSYVLVIEDF